MKYEKYNDFVVQSKSYLQAGDEIGNELGWIGHKDCMSKCPDKCDKKKWQYWKGKANANHGFWYFDHTLKVEGRVDELILLNL